MTRTLLAVLALAAGSTAAAPAAHAQHQYHVSVRGDDHNPGTKAKPFKTISAAAAVAQPGDVITVHAGTYRERVNPPRGGTSDAQRITYQAARGETVEIKGSEAVKGWQKVDHDTWKVVLPNSLFGRFNPYSDLIRGDWFSPQGREHHTGAVYLNGEPFIEAIKLEDALKPAGSKPLWFGKVEGDSTTLWAQFKGVDPNAQLVEVNARQSVFYPEKPGVNYITVRGFVMQHAATPWAPPTAEQIGLIGTHWSKGWVIENNVISHSRNVGITLGKYGDEFDNKAGSAEGYVGTIKRALANGWNPATIGHHVVRNNVIAYCGQAGIVGSLGAIYSTISKNVIHDIHLRPLYSGAEMAGIKLHGAIDVTISQNHIYRSVMGIWLDWMAQGTRVERNLLHDNRQHDLWVEVNHGPYLVANNIFLSDVALFDWSEGGAFAHNLMTGRIVTNLPQPRKTPYFKPHSTDLVDIVNITGGDMRFYNNVFLRPDMLRPYEEGKLQVAAAGNLFLRPADTALMRHASLRPAAPAPAPKLVQKGEEFYLEFTPGATWTAEQRQLVTTALLGKAKAPGQAYENADGTPLTIDVDYFGKKRKGTNPAPGPFEQVKGGTVVLKVWPQK